MSFQQRAQSEYFRRPDDERFASLDALHEHCSQEDRESEEIAMIPRGEVPIGVDGQHVTAGDARLTPWAFGNVSNLAKLSGRELGKLCQWGRPDLAAEALSTGLSFNDPGKGVIPYIRHDGNGGAIVRSLNGERYSRILNSRLTGGLLRLAEKGWKVPPAWGDKPSGLYASDRDLFVYMIDDDSRSIVKDPEAMNRDPEDLGRGFFLWNSEVGAKSFGLCCFWFNWTCGNHLVMGARFVQEIRIRHVGRIQYKVQRAIETTVRLAQDRTLAERDLGRMRAAMSERLTAKDSDLPKVLQSRTGIGPKLIEASIDKAWAEGSNPAFAWGAVQGMTAAAREMAHQDAAFELRRGAAKLLDADGKALPAITV
jgi:hypothetical protein